jgi:hypothetical protein
MTEIAVHPEFAASGSFGHLRLGRNTPPEPPHLNLEPFLTAALQPAAAEVDYYSAVPAWPMYENDELGDCTWATIGHLIQAWTQVAGAPVTPPDADIVQGYWETGTPPAATGTVGGETDDGRYETKVLAYWRHVGVPNTKDSIIGYAAVNAKNIDRVKFTVENFGGAYIGLAMPLTAETQAIWDWVPNDPNNAPGSWGGHAVPILGYDAEYLYVVTWGAVLKMTYAFWQHYGDACYAVISPDFIAHAAAAGVNTEGIVGQIGALTGQPVVAPLETVTAASGAATVDVAAPEGVTVSATPEAAGGDLPADPVAPAPAPDPAAEAVTPAPAAPAEVSNWAVSNGELVVQATDAVGAKTLYLRTLAENPDLMTATPANGD